MAASSEVQTPPRDWQPAPRRPWPARALRWALHWTLRAALILVLVVAGLAAYLWWTRPVPTPPVEIYLGITYECRRLPDTPESRGLAHLVTVDLAAPGIELYVTPTDPAATAAGWEYISRWAPAVAREQHTAVLVNACLFSTQSKTRLPGEYARSTETLVADFKVNHIWEATYLLWFQLDLTAHMETSKPPRPEVLDQARWALGSQAPTYYRGHYNDMSSTVDRRTMVGINPGKKLLFLGVFDHASYHAASTILAGVGATEIMPLDGGTSTALVLGSDAKGVRPGTKVYPLRALPVYFGVRADKLPG